MYVCAYRDVCACALYWEKKKDFSERRKRIVTSGETKKNSKKKKSFYCMLDRSTSESVSPCRRPLDWRLSRSALARIPRARTRSHTSAVFYRPAGQHTKSASK